MDRRRSRSELQQDLLGLVLAVAGGMVCAAAMPYLAWLGFYLVLASW